MNNNVRFIKCSQADYDKQTSIDNDALYFTEDTNRLYQGKKIFQGYKPLDLSKYTNENPFNAVKEGVTDGFYIVIKSGTIDMGSTEFGNVEVLESSILIVSNDSLTVNFTDTDRIEYIVQYYSNGKFYGFIITNLGVPNGSSNIYISPVMPVSDIRSDGKRPLLTYIESGLLYDSLVYYDYINMDLELKLPDENYTKVLTEQDIGTKVSAPLTWGTI